MNNHREHLAHKDTAEYAYWDMRAGYPVFCFDEGGVNMCLIMQGASPYEKSKVVDNGDGTGAWEDGTTFQDNKDKRFEDTNTECQAYILKAYPVEIQLSMASAIYPESVITPYREFVASCIEESNRVRDAILLATTQEELDAIQPIWPEVPNA